MLGKCSENARKLFRKEEYNEAKENKIQHKRVAEGTRARGGKVWIDSNLRPRNSEREADRQTDTHSQRGKPLTFFTFFGLYFFGIRFSDGSPSPPPPSLTPLLLIRRSSAVFLPLDSGRGNQMSQRSTIAYAAICCTLNVIRHPVGVNVDLLWFICLFVCLFVFYYFFYCIALLLYGHFTENILGRNDTRQRCGHRYQLLSAFLVLISDCWAHTQYLMMMIHVMPLCWALKLDSVCVCMCVSVECGRGAFRFPGYYFLAFLSNASIIIIIKPRCG